MVLSVKKTAKLLRLRLLLVYLHLLYTLPFWGQHVASYIAIRYVSCCASNQLVLDVLPPITTCGCLPTSNRFHQTAFWTPLAVRVTSPQSLQVGNSTDIFSGYIPFWISLTQVSDVVFRNPMLLKWEQTEQVLPLSYLKQQRWHVGIAGSLWCGLAVITLFPGTSGGMVERGVHGWGNFKGIQGDLERFITGPISVSCIPSGLACE